MQMEHFTHSLVSERPR